MRLQSSKIIVKHFVRYVKICLINLTKFSEPCSQTLLNMLYYAVLSNKPAHLDRGGEVTKT